MKPLKIAAGVMLSLAIASPALAAGASSTFDSNADGWMVRDISGSGSVAATWNSGGFISTTDSHGWVSFGAPAKFLGNLFGQKLSFDLYSQGNAASASTFFTVLIGSGTKSLYWFGGPPSTNGYSTFNVSLGSSSPQWKLGGSGYSDSGTAVTQEEFAAVLSNADRLQIDADWNLGADYVKLDNVTISPVPEPETYAMMLAGLGLLGFMARRKKLT